MKDARVVIAEFSNVVHGPAQDEDFSTFGKVRTWYGFGGQVLIHGMGRS
jgi:hypothetical protein